ncbi:MAG: hypothetical protein ACJAS4_003532 [Bacteriovoracaceae bacterium]
MNSYSSGIYNFVAIAFVGGTILLFAGEVNLATTKKAAQGSTKLTSFTNGMTGTRLDLSNERV